MTASAAVHSARSCAEIEVVDVHVGGDLHRIITGGIAALPGETVRDQMAYLRDHADGLRQLVLNEPRGGQPSVFADLVVPPCDPAAQAGYIIMETMGYPLISGTNTMSTAIALLETGHLPMVEGENTVTLEAPGGLVTVQAQCARGKVTSVSYEAQTPSFVSASDQQIDVPGWGAVRYDVLWTGAFYPVIDVAHLGLGWTPSDEAQLVAFAKAFIAAAREQPSPVHPVYGDEGPLSFVVFTGSPKAGADRVDLNVCCYVYPDAHVCRCPAGVPSTAAAVRLWQRGQLDLNQTLRTRSIFGTSLDVCLIAAQEYHGLTGLRARVTGAGWITAISRLIVDPSDPLTPREGLIEVLA